MFWTLQHHSFSTSENTINHCNLITAIFHLVTVYVHHTRALLKWNILRLKQIHVLKSFFNMSRWSAEGVEKFRGTTFPSISICLLITWMERSFICTTNPSLLGKKKLGCVFWVLYKVSSQFMNSDTI